MVLFSSLVTVHYDILQHIVQVSVLQINLHNVTPRHNTVNERYLSLRCNICQNVVAAYQYGYDIKVCSLLMEICRNDSETKLEIFSN